MLEACVEGVANPVGLASRLVEGLPETDGVIGALGLEAADGVGETAAVALQLLSGLVDVSGELLLDTDEEPLVLAQPLCVGGPVARPLSLGRGVLELEGL